MPFGAEVSSGMKLLVDDKSCLDMVNELGAARAVDIYTEPIEIDANEEIETQYEDEDVFALFRDDNIMDLDAPTHLVAKPNEQIGEKNLEDTKIMYLEAPTSVEDVQNEQEGETHEESDSACDVTGFTSDEDDEIREIRAKYEDIISKMKKSVEIPVDTLAELDVLQRTEQDDTHCLQITQGGYDLDSDQDVLYDEESDGVSTRRNRRYQIFDSCAETP